MPGYHTKTGKNGDEEYNVTKIMELATLRS